MTLNDSTITLLRLSILQSLDAVAPTPLTYYHLRNGLALVPPLRGITTEIIRDQCNALAQSPGGALVTVRRDPLNASVMLIERTDLGRAMLAESGFNQ